MSATMPMERLEGAAAPRRWSEHAPRLLVIDRSRTAHTRLARLDTVLEPGDLLVLNDAATLPASFHGVHAPTGRPVELRLLRHGGRDELWSGERRFGSWLAVAFGGGDWRTPTERREPPPALRRGDRVRLAAELEVDVTEVSTVSPRLVEVRFRAEPEHLVEAMYRAGRPIQYAHHRDDLELAEVQTPFAVHPVALEAPSASYHLRWDLLERLERRGIRWARLTHATGVSSTGDPEIDARLPFPERYWIPAETARAVNDIRHTGGRIIAVGTGVTRALETAAQNPSREVQASSGISMLRLDPDRSRRIVSGLLTGMHEAGSSHLDLLGAFVPGAKLERAYREAVSLGYFWHDYGDLCLVLGDRLPEPADRGTLVSLWPGTH